MKFLVDKALSPQTVIYLRDNGYHAVRVNEVIPGTVIEDETIFQYAIENGYS
jgi:predicted nuclease of predicted toxin-antitoxin system